MLAVNLDVTNDEELATKSVICNAAHFLHQFVVAVWHSVQLRDKLRENYSAVSIIRVELCYRKLNNVNEPPEP